jgi:hypothetical protein
MEDNQNSIFSNFWKKQYSLIYVKNPKPNISCLGPFKMFIEPLTTAFKFVQKHHCQQLYICSE